MTVRRDAMNTLTVQAFTLAAGLVTNIVVARTLGPEGKGLLSFLGYTLFVSVSLATIGLQPAAIQHLGKRRFDASTVAGTQLVLSATTGLLCAGLLLIILPAFSKAMPLDPQILIYYVPLVFLAILRVNSAGVIIGLRRIQTNNKIQAISPASWMLGALVVLGLLHGNAVAGVFTWIAAQAVSPLTTLFYMATRIRPRFHGLGACIRASLRFGMEAYLANVIWTMLLRSGALLLAYLGGAASVGIYSIAILMGETLWYLPRALTMALNPRVAAGTQQEAMHLSLRASRIALWLVIAAGAVLLLIGRPLILFVFGDAFAPSFRPLALLLPGVIGGSIASPIALYFIQYKARPRVNAWVAAVGLSVSLGLNLLWIPRFGPEGAAGASSVAYLLVAGLLVWQLSREPGFSWGTLLWPRGEDVRGLRQAIGELLSRGPR
ncbi:MAG: oligosaccharide flippase family protein [Candidatus Eisenbacteria sp.]|nr:oligosaccharide flippase family protein [Candidatus Eisenbacteria bacterium]